jgi:hypothetical protein
MLVSIGKPSISSKPTLFSFCPSLHGNGHASASLAYDLGTPQPVTSILVSRSTSRGAQGTPYGNHTLAEAQRDIGRVFSISRARHDGFPVRKVPPLFSLRYAPVYSYMLAKYTLRWGFYRFAARLCHAPRHRSVCEVVNPAKDHKIEEVAIRHQMDPVALKCVSGKLRRFWPLLP